VPVPKQGSQHAPTGSVINFIELEEVEFLEFMGATDDIVVKAGLENK
jgi:hypothetical protein